ncbi:MAG: TonB-dependent receptor [Longimicrobiales bacterium]
MTPLLAFLALGLALQQDPITQRPGQSTRVVRAVAEGMVRGQVRSGVNGPPIAFAAVEVIGARGVDAAVTDQHGGYVLAGVPPGRQLLRASHIGHAALEVGVLVPAGGEVDLDFNLELRPVPLPAVTAVGAPPLGFADSLAVPAPDLGRASVRALESSGVVEIGLGDIARATPGNQPPDPTDVLYVRGAAADLKLVLLDGAPVYAPFHLGGLINPFDADMLGAADLYIGGAPARYDGGLSYVLNLTTRRPRDEPLRGELELDMLSSRARVEGAVSEGAGYLIGGRYVHGAGAALGEAFPYGYGDGLMRLHRTVPGGGAMSATGFVNRESVELRTADQGRGTAAWGNRAGSVRYAGPLLGGDAEFAVGAGRFTAGLPIIGRHDLWVDGAASRIRMTADLMHATPSTSVQYGLSYERQWLDYRTWARGVEPDSLILETNLTGDVSGGYFDLGWQPQNDVRLHAGVRLDVFSSERAPRLAPRLSLTWLAGRQTALTLAAGRYHQYVRAPESVLTSPAAEDELTEAHPIDGDPLLDIARASHLVLSLDQQLPEGVRLGVEGFLKAYEGVPTEDPDGTAQASGVDLWVRRSEGRVQGWLGYSLAWIWSAEALSRPAEEIFAGRHLVSAGMLGGVGAHARYGLRLTYGAGLPFTAIQPGSGTPPTAAPPSRALVPAEPSETVIEPSPLVGSPDEPYLRIDAELARTWLVSWRGAPMELTPYLRVINALNRRDALFYHFDATDQTEPQALAALPIVPVFGFGWRF